MSNAPLLSDIIKLLKTQLIEADNDSSNTGLMIDKAEISLGFSIGSDESGNALVSYHDDQRQARCSNLKLTLSRPKVSTKHSDLELIEDKLRLDETPSSDDFESFKSRFQASVKRKHGQSPRKKKSIFECD